MIHKLLLDIGLSDKEATMYMTLLRHGTQTTSLLAKRAELNRGTAYVILHQLLSKGLATTSMKQKVQYFTPLDPKNLPQYLDHKQQELVQQKEKVQALMGQLAAITNPLTAKPKIQFFDGPEGARNVLESTLEATDKNLRAFLSLADITAFAGTEFFKNYTDRRVKAGLSLQAIRTSEKDKLARASDKYAKEYMTNKKQKRTVRYITEDLAFPITMYLYDNKIGIISSKEEGFALIIESKELSDMQRKLFDLLWKSVAK